MNEPTAIKIVQQGRMVINDARVYHRGPTVVAIIVDMKSKRGAVSGEFSDDNDVPGVMIEATDESLHTDDAQPPNLDTVIAFPEFVGWRVWCADLSKYSVNVCLTKRPEVEP